MGYNFQNKIFFPFNLASSSMYLSSEFCRLQNSRRPRGRRRLLGKTHPDSNSTAKAPKYQSPTLKPGHFLQRMNPTPTSLAFSHRRRKQRERRRVAERSPAEHPEGPVETEGKCHFLDSKVK